MAAIARKNVLGTALRFLNQPIVKESVKNIASTASFTFGIMEIYDISQILSGREISTETSSEASKWRQVAAKVTLVCAKISLILSAATSRPGVFILSTLGGCVFSNSQLEYFFGPNTVFVVNPWHPRHIFSIAAVILALPALIQSTYQGVRWAYTTISRPENSLRQAISPNRPWLTDTKIRMMAVFNTLTSRPVQHLGNQLCRAAIPA